MRKYRSSNDGADRDRNFKGETDYNSIKKAVCGKAGRAEGASPPQFFRAQTLVAIKKDAPVELRFRGSLAGCRQVRTIKSRVSPGVHFRR